MKGVSSREQLWGGLGSDIRLGTQHLCFRLMSSWESYFTCLCLSFFIWKIGIITASTLTEQHMVSTQ